jgi:CelD/BcsL family acetyltransferase involved in cellulose biosynthesis
MRVPHHPYYGTERRSQFIDIAGLLGLKWGNRKGERLDSIQKIYRTMLMHCFSQGLLFLPVLWKGEMPLGAVALLIDPEKRSLLFYVGGRDTTVSSPPPGFVLHAYSIRYAIHRGFITYDFLRGNESYKYSFGKNERRIRHIVVGARDVRKPRATPDGRSPSIAPASAFRLSPN